MFSSLRKNWQNRRPFFPGEGRQGKLTQNSKGRANGWIAYPFINAIHFAINNTVKSSQMCPIKTLRDFNAKTKKSPLCCILWQYVPNISTAAELQLKHNGCHICLAGAVTTIYSQFVSKVFDRPNLTRNNCATAKNVHRKIAQTTKTRRA